MIETTPDQQQIAERNKHLQTTYFKSKFYFLRSHNGFRPGCLHGLLGVMSGGKSSLAKVLIAEAAYQGKTLVWLTEESRQDYVADFAKIIPADVLPRVLSNVLWLEEKALPATVADNIDAFYSYMQNQIARAGCKALFIDNITTSRIYDGSLGKNSFSKTSKWLSKIAKALSLPIIYLVHTRKEITANYHRVLTPEDIRGFATIAIESEFFYVMQKFTQQDRIVNIVRLAKHRGYESPPKTWFRLIWENGRYCGDTALNFESIKAIFKEKDAL